MNHRPLPPFDKLAAHYPYKQTVLLLKKTIGGAVDDTKAAPDKQWLGGASGDTCTLRMSRAFNYSGGVIPNHAHGMETVKGGDSRCYGFRAREFDAWLRSFYGPPDVEVKGKPVSRDKFLGRTGVMSFDITFGLNADGRTRATGHVDLWDGVTFFDELNGISRPNRDFFDIANGVALWTTPGTAVLPRS
jgi:hypothetical protein